MGLKEAGLRGSLRNVSTGVPPIPDEGLYLDDWEDSKLDNRDSYSDLQYAFIETAPEDSDFDDPIRPVWTEVQGSVTVSTGEMTVEGESQSVDTIVECSRVPDLDGPRTFFTTCRLDSTGSGPGRNGDWQFIYNDDDNHWRLGSNSEDEGYSLEKRDGGSFDVVIDGSGADIDITENNDVRVEYDGDEGWELFINDDSQGTATDSFDPTVNDNRIVSDERNMPAWTFSRMEVF